MAAWIDKIWEKLGLKVVNIIKIEVLEKHLNAVLRFFDTRLKMAKGRYCKNLPYHVLETEKEDLDTISQLELIETIKIWDPVHNDEVWPLAQTRIVGALKDHIRYITKSNPTRVYEWVNEQAQNYVSTKTQTDHATQYAMKDQLKFAMKELSERERLVIRAHVKQDQTFKTIGESIKLSESQVSRIYKGAIKKMKRIIEKDQEA